MGPLPLPLPVATRAGGMRGIVWASCGDGADGIDWSDPEDSERSAASIGLVVRTLTVDGNAVIAAATPAPAAPAAPRAAGVTSAELLPCADPEVESDDPGSTCTMTVPSALEETWLPTRLPSAT